MKTAKITLNIGLKNNPLSIADCDDLNGFEAERLAYLLASVWGPRRFNFDFAVGEWEGEKEPTAIIQFEFPLSGDGLDEWYVERLTRRLADMLTQECIPVTVEQGNETYGVLAYSQQALGTLEPQELCEFSTQYFKDLENVLESFNVEIG